ncbi:UDP-3-O-(3-hydroxymyristoyl)glucosamine N-acyltransferase [Nevskia ramosa]|uniref:UDP-3-O-(3-hydroxymyristoyl)glucosamine N-acyltransferase n=1 Tax=Nevskia ramosa TaxID=64002 RepID=UPI0003B741AC|nr:UDP-3-O-(3-hydroxymyristoyl)glucosamine N-acyltransferase [Nevskia ramosa]
MSPRPTTTLAALAERHGLELRGDGAIAIEGVCSLLPGKPGHLGFFANSKLRKQLSDTRAAAVILSARDAAGYVGNALVSTDTALAFGRIAREFDRAEEFVAGRHASASIDPLAQIGDGCGVAAGAVIEADAVIGAGSYIGPNCVIRRGAAIGAGSRLEANVYIGPDCVLGARARLLPGAVIGGRGFGLAPSSAGWIEVPQLGRVIIGDDVEIGANTTIDRGALDDTVIEDGVKLDNQIQIAHNCRIGARTAIAACTGIAGSTTIGRNCMIGGASVIGGHLTIVDNVVVFGYAMVTKSITAPGQYGSGIPAKPAREWRREVARIRRLPKVDERLAAIEQILKMTPVTGEEQGEQGDF